MYGKPLKIYFVTKKSTIVIVKFDILAHEDVSFAILLISFNENCLYAFYVHSILILFIPQYCIYSFLRFGTLNFVYIFITHYLCYNIYVILILDTTAYSML